MSETTKTNESVETTEGEEIEFTHTQDDIDRVAKKVRAEEQAKQKDLISIAVQSAIEERERQSKLSEDELKKEMEAKHQKEIKSQKKELETQQKELTIRERKIEATEILVEKGLDKGLVDLVLDENKDLMLSKIEQLSKNISTAIEAGVNDKLKQSGRNLEDFSIDKKDTPKGMPQSM